jgi:hypothetical protein
MLKEQEPRLKEKRIRGSYMKKLKAGCILRGRALAYNAQGPEFDLQHHKKEEEE